MTEPGDYKECEACHRLLDRNADFYRRDATSGKPQSRCKECMSRGKTTLRKLQDNLHPHAVWLRKEIGL